MISVKTDKTGTEIRCTGNAFEIRAEAALVFVKAVAATSEDAGKEKEVEFEAMLLTTIDLAEKMGLRIDKERFTKALNHKKEFDNAWEGLQKIFGKMKDSVNG